MAGFRPLRKNGSSARGSDDGDDDAESGVPLVGEDASSSGNHYQYNVDSYDSYDGAGGGDGNGAPPGTGGAGDEDSYERGAGAHQEDGGSEAVKRQQVQAQKKKRMLIGGALFSVILLLGGVAVAGYFIWDQKQNGNNPNGGDGDGTPTMTEPVSGTDENTNNGTAIPEETNSTSPMYCARSLMMDGGSTGNRRAQDVSTSSSSSTPQWQCHPDVPMLYKCAFDSDCETAMGPDSVAYGTCVDMKNCSTTEVATAPPVAPLVKYCSGVMPADMDGTNEGADSTTTEPLDPERHVCHPEKIECTSDANCTDTTFGFTWSMMYIETNKCRSGDSCEILEIDTPKEEVVNGTLSNTTDMFNNSTSNATVDALFSLSLTMGDAARDECMLSPEEQATFCEGVAQGAGAATLLGIDTGASDVEKANVPLCEVQTQVCNLSSVLRLRQLRQRALQNAPSFTLELVMEYKLSWMLGSQEEASVMSTALVDAYLDLASTPVPEDGDIAVSSPNPYLEGLKTFLMENANLAVASITEPEFLSLLSFNGTNTTELLNNVTDTMLNETMYNETMFNETMPAYNETMFNETDTNSTMPNNDTEPVKNTNKYCGYWVPVPKPAVRSLLQLEPQPSLTLLSPLTSNMTTTNSTNGTDIMNGTMPMSLNNTMIMLYNMTTNGTDVNGTDMMNGTMPFNNMTMYNTTMANSTEMNATDSGIMVATAPGLPDLQEPSFCDAIEADPEAQLPCFSDGDCMGFGATLQYTCLEFSLCSGGDMMDNTMMPEENELVSNSTNTTNTNSTLGNNETFIDGGVDLESLVLNMTTTNGTNTTDAMNMTGYCGHRVPKVILNETSFNVTDYLDTGNTSSMYDNICRLTMQPCAVDTDCMPQEGEEGDLEVVCLDECTAGNSTNNNTTQGEVVPSLPGTDTEPEMPSLPGTEPEMPQGPGGPGTMPPPMGANITTLPNTKRCGAMVEPNAEDPDLILTDSGISLSCSPFYLEECTQDAECQFALGDPNSVCVFECGPMI